MGRWKSFGIIALIIVLIFEIAYIGENPGVLFQPEPETTPESTPPPLPTLPPEPTATPEPTPYVPLPAAEEMWMLAIASADYPLEEEYEVETVPVGSAGYLFDARASGALEAMLAAAEADGLSLNITSAWRSRATQAQLYENRVYRFQLEGYSREEAEELGATVVARPGTSEHELGLSVDLVTDTYTSLDEGFAEQPEYQWLLAHCAEYGFIQRYPPEKSDITGIIWEPWHFRYVGVEAAEYIMEHNLCLEEFLELAGLLPEEGESRT